MATHCENCGTKIRGFLSFNETIVWSEDEKGNRHEFCSQGCAHAWTQKHSRHKEPSIDSNLAEDLEALYYKKTAEYKTMIEAQSVISCSDEREAAQMEPRINRIKKEIIKICQIIGREPRL